MYSSARRLLGTVSAGCAIGAALLASPTVAGAHSGPPSFGTCPANPVSQPFAPWGDGSSYELAPGGDFESTDPSSSWALSGGAQLVSGSETYAATGTLGASSLSLPAGASAQAPATCVTAAYPTLRFFVAGSGTAAVSVVYGPYVIPTGVVVANGGWTATQVIPTGSLLAALMSGGTAQLSIQLTGLTGSVQVDDVFIDPWVRG